MPKQPLKSAFFSLGLSVLLIRPVTADYCQWQSEQIQGLIEINQPLCNLEGDVERGKRISIDRGLGNCLACHQMPIPEESFHGQIGPPLVGVASRYSTGHLRLRLVNARLFNPMTIMPAYYLQPEKVNRIAFRYEKTTLLTAQQVEDVLAYLETLK